MQVKFYIDLKFCKILAESCIKTNVHCRSVVGPLRVMSSAVI